MKSRVLFAARAICWEYKLSFCFVLGTVNRDGVPALDADGHVEAEVLIGAIGLAPDAVGGQVNGEGDGGNLEVEVPGVGAGGDGALEGGASVGAHVVVLALVVLTEDLDISVDVGARLDLSRQGSGDGEVGGHATGPGRLLGLNLDVSPRATADGEGGLAGQRQLGGDEDDSKERDSLHNENYSVRKETGGC